MRVVGLLGTAFTMEQDFLYDEPCAGIVNESSRATYQDVIRSLQARGAQAVILGCTEIGLLIQPGHSPLPLFDTTLLHARAAVAFALQDP